MLALDTSFNEKEHSNMKRFDQKTLIVIEWLSMFRFSTQQILLERLALKNRNFFTKLKKRNLIREVSCDTTPSKLIVLTKNGAIHAAENFEHGARALTDSSRINPTTARHDLSVQRVVISYLDRADSVISERFIQFGIQGKVPDALVNIDSMSYAFEIERTHKTKPRIYQAFQNHLYKLRDGGGYDRVKYFFPKDALLKMYTTIFNETDWPIYEFSTSRNRWVTKQDILESDGVAKIKPTDLLRSRFEFSVVDML